MQDQVLFKLDGGVTGSRSQLLAEEVRNREARKCGITGIPEGLKRNRDSNEVYRGPRMRLEGIHLFRRCVGKLHKNGKSAAGRLPDKDAVNVFTVLTLFFGLSDKFLGNLKGSIDHPSNLIAGNTVVHCAIDAFEAALGATQNVNEYRVIMFRPLTVPPKGDIITFENHADKDVALPNPLCVRVHAVVAEALNRFIRVD
ncbi:hypothetical protein K466DRAFT_348647 [Polyporus arcularius HHB13444]|uniref:HNH nuclease domain-containing protein n=1 Tax=Polyporus arcularius HHB13444 TaxID=1314778 RepID=A0A5C3P5U2_9APHY|nr:hypothetical protein K466DRAFT_348647 [Polyporus arcularius HHB13444]